jgi:hypothetical protein
LISLFSLHTIIAPQSAKHTAGGALSRPANHTRIRSKIVPSPPCVTDDSRQTRGRYCRTCDATEVVSFVIARARRGRGRRICSLCQGRHAGRPSRIAVPHPGVCAVRVRVGVRAHDRRRHTHVSCMADPHTQVIISIVMLCVSPTGCGSDGRYLDL